MVGRPRGAGENSEGNRGPGPGQYLWTDAERLKADIESAKVFVFNDQTATQEGIDKAIAKLMDAVAGFESTMVPLTQSAPADARGGGCDAGMGLAGMVAAVLLILGCGGASASPVPRGANRTRIRIIFGGLLALALAALLALTLLFARTAAAADTTAPVPGGWITKEPLGEATTLTLRWPAADDQTPADSLKYRAYFSLDAKISTVEECEKNGTLLEDLAGTDMGEEGILNYTAGGLSPDTQYWFNVVVEDEAGNKEQYGMMSMITGRGSGPTLEITIEEAQLLLRDADIEDDPAPGQYPREAADKLEAALEDAQSELDNLPEDPDEAAKVIDKAIRNLLVEMAAFEDSVAAADPTSAAPSDSGGCNAGFGVFGGAILAIFSLKRKRR